MSAQPALPDDGWWLPIPDKLAHLGVYAVLGAALAHAKVFGPSRVPHVAMIALGALFGVTDEWHQSFVPGRDPSVGDWLADVAGVAFGYGMTWLLATAWVRRGTETGEGRRDG